MDESDYVGPVGRKQLHLILTICHIMTFHHKLFTKNEVLARTSYPKKVFIGSLDLPRHRSIRSPGLQRGTCLQGAHIPHRSASLGAKMGFETHVLNSTFFKIKNLYAWCYVGYFFWVGPLVLLKSFEF